MKVGNNIEAAVSEPARPAGGHRVPAAATIGAIAGAVRTATPLPGVTSGAQRVGEVQPGESVTLSADSRSVSNAARGDGDNIRQDKVDEIRNAIDQGRYRVDVAAIAEKMIRESAELMQTMGDPPRDMNSDGAIDETDKAAMRAERLERAQFARKSDVAGDEAIRRSAGSAAGQRAVHEAAHGHVAGNEHAGGAIGKSASGTPRG